MTDLPDGGRRRPGPNEHEHDDSRAVEYRYRPPKQDDPRRKMRSFFLPPRRRQASHDPGSQRQEVSPVSKWEPLPLFSQPARQAPEPGICPECGMPVLRRRVVSLLNDSYGQEVMLDPVPAGPTGEYVLIGDDRCRLRSLNDPTAPTYYMPHLRGCRGKGARR